MKTITKECKCGAAFETTAPLDEWPDFTAKKQCDACQAKQDDGEAVEIQRRKGHLAASLAQEVQSLTPPRLRTPDTLHPAFNLDLWQKVQAWEPTREKPWLGIIGQTGECKTRCAFLRLHQFAIADAQAWNGLRDVPKLDALAITGMEFNRLVVSQHSKEEARAGSWFCTGRGESVGTIASRTLRKARSVDILIFDELGKVKPTAGTVNEIFDLIDYRTSHNEITIWTSNTKPEQFCKAWGEEYSESGFGRILEASIIIMA
jgi:hypothetical protein